MGSAGHFEVAAGVIMNSGDRFERHRAAWVERHAFGSASQRRRAEVLKRRIRDRERSTAGVAADAHAERITDPAWLRAWNRRTAEHKRARRFIPWLIVWLTISLVAGPALLGGRVLLVFLEARVPDRAARVPVGVMGAIGCATSSIAVGADVLLSPSLTAMWAWTNVMATPLAGAMFAVLWGWSAVPSTAVRRRPALPRRRSAQEDEQEAYGTLAPVQHADPPSPRAIKPPRRAAFDWTELEAEAHWREGERG